MSAKKRVKVGLLISEYYDDFMRSACEGAMQAAEERDVDLYLLTGGYLKSNYVDDNKKAYDYQNNFVFNYAENTGLDVIVAFVGTIAGMVDKEAKKEFLQQFKGIPVITAASEFEGYTSLLFDNKKGFYAGVEYLIKEQGRKKLGMVSGPATNLDAWERLEAFREALANNGLSYNDEQVVYGTFSEYSGSMVIKDLLDRNLDLDGIVFANDYMAKGAYPVLEERGFVIGKDIAVIGFDDAEAAPLMEPPLTTTRADSRELGYQSILKACEILKDKDGGIKHFRIDTALIIRESCGGKKDSDSNSGLNVIKDPTGLAPEELADKIVHQIFDYSEKNSNISFLRSRILRLVQWMNGNIYGKKIDFFARREMEEEFETVLYEMLERSILPAPLFDLTQVFVELYQPHVDSDASRAGLQEARAEIYRDIQMYADRNRDDYIHFTNLLNWTVMDITRDANRFQSEEDKYGFLLRKMSDLDIASSYIYGFDGVLTCESPQDWKRPENLFLKVYQEGKKSFVPEIDKQVVPVEKMFEVVSGNDDRRKTFSVNMLFSGADQYGLFIMEATRKGLFFIEPLRFQISSALQTINLMMEKGKMTKQLEMNLLELQETNAFLDEVSKSDELTQIYNRRGMLVTAKKLVRNEENIGKQAVFIYADMNNLKLVNDRFGHEEGDYSLRSIAEILKVSLGKTAIIGRMGGDEFAAFMIADEEQLEQGIFEEDYLRERINEKTEELNAGNTKPYYVSLSAGMKFFEIEEQTDFDQMMADADAQLYQWKKVKRTDILK